MAMKAIYFYLLLITSTITGYENGTQKVLSRKKRYLIFPEGSSLQLVYCLTMPVIGHSNIFTIGGTAAIAWELPSEPYHSFKKNGHQAQEKVDNSQIIKYKKNSAPSYYTKQNYVYPHPVYHQVHRRTRRDLYSKIEKFFSAQNKDGKSCLLKSVCEVSQATSGRGTFMMEIIKAIFRVKPYDGYEDEDEYDKAANKKDNCTELYPGCQASVWNVM